MSVLSYQLEAEIICAFFFTGLISVLQIEFSLDDNLGKMLDNRTQYDYSCYSWIIMNELCS